MQSRTILIEAFAALALMFLGAQGAFANHYQVLYSFKGGNDGFWPAANVVRDSSGNLYGATVDGGGNTNCRGGCGAIFKLDRNGKESLLYNFSGPDGEYPFGVTRDARGTIYGATVFGGNPDCQNMGESCGVAYKLDSKGNFTLLHTFEGGSDGTNPEGVLVLDSSGNLYGTTVAGGAGGGCSQDYPRGCGTVFKLAPNGQETILYAFAGADGESPVAGLVRDTDGNLYGSTLYGGTNDAGVIFKISKDGKETVLHDFTGVLPDNGWPYDGLAWDGGDYLYGTAEAGQFNVVFGSVFKLNLKTHVLTTLFSFDQKDGANPVVGVTLDQKGNVFGTTSHGGSCKSNGCGVVFEVDKNGVESTLYNFGPGPHGKWPSAILARDADGNLFGTALGGRSGAGVIFKVSP